MIRNNDTFPLLFHILLEALARKKNGKIKNKRDSNEGGRVKIMSFYNLYVLICRNPSSIQEQEKTQNRQNNSSKNI